MNEEVVSGVDDSQATTIGASAGKYRANCARRLVSMAVLEAVYSSGRLRRVVSRHRAKACQLVIATISAVWRCLSPGSCAGSFSDGKETKSPDADGSAIGSCHTPASMSQVSWNQWFDAEAPLARMSPS